MTQKNEMTPSTIEIIPTNDNFIDQKLRLTCSFCRKTNTKITMHHYPLPRWLGGKEVIPLCIYCHNAFESSFTNFIKYGQLKRVTWTDPENAKITHKRCCKEWLQKNHDKTAKYSHLKYWKNPEKYRLEKRVMRAKDPKGCKEKDRIWRKNNPDKLKKYAYSRRQYQAEYQRKYRLKNKNNEVIKNE
jgi:hypothetical protein